MMEQQAATLLLPQNEFPRLRDAYQQCFEAVCKSLILFVYAANLVRNNDPEDFRGIRYTQDNKVTEVHSRGAFNRLANANRLKVLRESSPFYAVLLPLDSKTRNAIGHASARHDLRTGMIVNAKGDSERYFDFVGKVYRLALPMMAAVQETRHARVYAATLPPSTGT